MGILSASGLIAGEALMGLVIATVVFVRDQMGAKAEFWSFEGVDGFASWLTILFFALLASYLIYVPLSKAGKAKEPAPPTAIM